VFWIGLLVGILVGALANVGVEKLKALINKA
jgi:hypothetical protein